MTTQNQGTLANFAFGLIIVCLFVYICKIASAILIPFVVAVFVWYLLNAIARFLSFAGLEIARAWRLMIAIFILFGFFFSVFEIVHQNADNILRAAPRYQENFSRIVPALTRMMQLDHTPTVHELFREVIEKYVDIGAMLRLFAGLLTGIAGKTLIVLFYVGFLLYEQRYFDRKIRLMIKNKQTEDRVRHILHTIDAKVQKYIGVKAFVSAVDSMLTFFILSVFSVDFASFWGVMAFFLHFIPYAGSFIAIAAPVTIALVQFGDLSVFFMVLATLCTSHAFLGHVLDPYLMGNNLNLSPIFIISNLAMWGMIWGIPGMFLAIPILAIVVISLSQFERTKPLSILFSKTGTLDKPPPKLKFGMRRR